jgi:hypothetical protein
MHSIHCGCAMFPYQVLKRRSAQETLIGCEGLRNIKISKALNIHSVCIVGLNSEDGCLLHTHRRENLKSYLALILFTDGRKEKPRGYSDCLPTQYSSASKKFMLCDEEAQNMSEFPLFCLFNNSNLYRR